ncbi:MAG: hypothetical protein HEQ35_20470 [Gloeotrichia echinulata IR180]
MNDGKRGYSPGQIIEDLYEEVFDTIYKEIENQQIGILSTVIYSILAPDESKAEELCQHFQVKGSGSLNDDLAISSSILSGVIGILHLNGKKQYRYIVDKLGEFSKEPLEVINGILDLHKSEEIKKMKLYPIVVIGCLIVGVSYCLIYLQKKKEEQEEKENRENSSSPRKKVSKRIALCLVLPASVVRNIKRNVTRSIREKDPIFVFDIETLIENASYFLCTSAENEATTDIIDRSLSTTNEDIINVSEEREVYVRINIHVDDAEEMIGNKVRYILKTNLPTDERTGTIEKLVCLEYLSVSGLEKFNRV